MSEKIFRKSFVKKAVAVSISIACAGAFMLPGISQSEVNAAAKTPAKVTGLKAAKVTSSSVTLAWNKAKDAKTYKVYQKKSTWTKWKNTTKKNYKKYQNNKKTYKVRVRKGAYQYKVKKAKYANIKSAKKTKATVYDLDQLKTYTFKVRAYNGKKAGKYSSAVTVKTKDADLEQGIHNKAGQSVTVKINGQDVNLTVGKVCTVPAPEKYLPSSYTQDVKITNIESSKEGTEIKGKTPEGKNYYTWVSDSANCVPFFYRYGIDESTDSNEYFEYVSGISPDNGGLAPCLRIKDKDVKIVYTLDNTEPQLDQVNSTERGYCFYTIGGHHAVQDKNDKLWYPVPDFTYLKGTLTYNEAKGKEGKCIFKESSAMFAPRAIWYKVYYKNTLVGEYKEINGLNKKERLAEYTKGYNLYEALSDEEKQEIKDMYTE